MSDDGMGDKVRRREARAVDEILANRPLRLPGRLVGVGETLVMYRNLGVLLAGGGLGMTTTEAELPSGWTCRRTDRRSIEVLDESGEAVIRAFYKFAPHETKAYMYLTNYGRACLRRKWDALPRWRRLLANRANWGVDRVKS